MKIAPLCEELRRYSKEFSPIVVHTGQHYDKKMSSVFFKDLEMPPPDHFLQAETNGTVSQMGDIIAKFDRVLKYERPARVVVVGDVVVVAVIVVLVVIVVFVVIVLVAVILHVPQLSSALGFLLIW